MLLISLTRHINFSYQILIFVLLIFPNFIYANNQLSMSVISRNITAYNNFLSEKKQTVLEVDNLNSIYANRNVACMVIIMQALDKGGYTAELSMVEAPNYGRELILVKEGKVAIMHQDAWDTSVDDNTFKSSVIIPYGKLVKGIYVAEDNLSKFNINSSLDLKKYSAVSNPDWNVGWQTLEKLNLKGLYKSTKQEHMFNLVLFRGVDFTIQEFANTDDLSYSFKGKKLLPIPKVKLALNGSRHFIISKKHQDGEKIYQALEKGLQIMREKGVIDRYLTESGFYRKEVDDWKVIYINDDNVTNLIS